MKCNFDSRDLQPAKTAIVPEPPTLRDQYACAALTGLLAGGGIRVNQSPYIGTNNEAYDLMKSAFEIADEALRQRDKT